MVSIASAAAAIVLLLELLCELGLSSSLRICGKPPHRFAASVSRANAASEGHTSRGRIIPRRRDARCAPPPTKQSHLPSLTHMGRRSKKEITMNKKASLALATGLLLVSAAAASAAGPQSTSSPNASPSASSTMSKPATDKLSLTSTEQKSAWKDLNGQATNQ